MDIPEVRDNTYDLVITDKMTLFPYEETSKEIVSKFDAYLVKLDKFLFLDIFPKEPEIKGVMYKFHLIPVHTFWRVWIEGDILRLATLNYDWFKDMAKSKKISIPHERLDEHLAERLGGGTNSIILLTASTKELHEFVVKYAEDNKAFQPGELHRQKDQEKTSLGKETQRENAKNTAKPMGK
mgnify:FL=1